ncbi:uncharacterized protein [Littorina saxatilis]|uniref:Uncharacterized protein n=1 Tax=Littorina saxatilis TaxID=31220 RepID=A0AAN9BFD5_9CAEN
MGVMLKKDVALLCLMGLSMVLYSLAAITHAWFTLPPHSFYGIWSVVFCDFLQCQIIPAMFSDEPGWYHILQLLCIISWLGLGAAFFMMLLPNNMHKILFPDQMVIHHHTLTSAICYVSALAIFLSLIIFYGKLCESSNVRPSVSWSSALAVLSGMGDFTVGLLLMKS